MNFSHLDCGPKGSTQQCYEFLYDLAQHVPQKHCAILEVGTHYGVSTVALAKGAPGSLVVTVDPIYEPMSAIQWHSEHVKNHVLFLRGDSREILPRLTKRFDFAFLDGSHDVEDVLADIENAANLTDIIVLHDVGTESNANSLWSTVFAATVERFLPLFAGTRSLIAANSSGLSQYVTERLQTMTATSPAYRNGKIVNHGCPAFGVLLRRGTVA